MLIALVVGGAGFGIWVTGDKQAAPASEVIDLTGQAPVPHVAEIKAVNKHRHH